MNEKKKIIGTNHSSLSFRHLKDWPHRSVVSMQSSVRLTGNLRQSTTRFIAMIV
jgi:hypothetical protein